MGITKWERGEKTRNEKEKCRRISSHLGKRNQRQKNQAQIEVAGDTYGHWMEKEKILSTILLLMVLFFVFLSVRYLAVRLWFGLSFQINVLLQSYTFLRAISSFAYAKKDACISSSLFSQSHCHFFLLFPDINIFFRTITSLSFETLPSNRNDLLSVIYI